MKEYYRAARRWLSMGTFIGLLRLVIWTGSPQGEPPKSPNPRPPAHSETVEDEKRRRRRRRSLRGKEDSDKEP